MLYETAKKEITSLALDSTGNLYVAAIGDKRPGTPQPPATQADQNNNAAQGTQITVTVGGAPAVVQPDSRVRHLLLSRRSPRPPYTASLQTVRPRRFGPPATSRSIPSGYRRKASYCSAPAITVPSCSLKMTASFRAWPRPNPNKSLPLRKRRTGKSMWPPPIPGRFSLSVLSWNPKAPLNPNRSTLASSRAGAGSPGGAKTPRGSGIELYVRAGNTSDPGKNWTPWAGPYRDPKGQEVESQAARFVQWKAVLHGGANPAGSLLDRAGLPAKECRAADHRRSHSKPRNARLRFRPAIWPAAAFLCGVAHACRAGQRKARPTGIPSRRGTNRRPRATLRRDISPSCGMPKTPMTTS